MTEVCVQIEPYTPVSEGNENIPAAEADAQKTAIQLNLAGLVVAITVLLCIFSFGKVFVAPFSITDTDIIHPMGTEIVHYGWVLAFGFILPPAVILIFSLREKLGRYSIFSRLIYYLFGFAFTVVITEFFKLSVGRLRPDFLDRCKPDPLTMLCTGNEKIVTEGRKSFPSGHASTALYIGMFLIFWLWRVVKVGRSLIRSLLGIMVLLGVFCVSAFVAISRLQQFVHHPTDVLAGSVIGLLVAYFITSIT